jgi:hypothetical protein
MKRSTPPLILIAISFAPYGARTRWRRRFSHGLRHGLRSFTRVQNRWRQVGNEVQHNRSLCGEAAGLSLAGGRDNLFPAKIEEIHCPRPLGGEGGPQPAFSSAGAGRVRGSKTLRPSEMLSTLRPFHFCVAIAAPSNEFHFGKDPLTPRLAVPPLPQGGEGK